MIRDVYLPFAAFDETCSLSSIFEPWNKLLTSDIFHTRFLL
jgi:hypothetical protein